MRRKDFYKLLSPLIDKIYSIAYTLLPDDLQAEQLVIDSINAHLFKEKKIIQAKVLDLTIKKEVQAYRKIVFKNVVSHLAEIGIRRSLQLEGLSFQIELGSFGDFFSLSPKLRLILKLHYDQQFTIDEISDVLELPRFEVIESLHNAKHLLLINPLKSELGVQ